MADAGSPGERVLIRALSKKILDLERVIGILVKENSALRARVAELESGEPLAVVS